MLALRLAKQLDSATAVSAASALASQIRDLMREALEGWSPPVEPDFVDAMAERRGRRRAQ